MSSTAAPFQSAPPLVVLHALRIVGRVRTSTLPELTGLPVAVVDEELRAAAGAGHVRLHDGVVAGWSLTTDGRHRHAELLADERVRSDRESEIGAAYEDFVGLNGWFKALCTEWQLRGHPPSCVQRLDARHHEVDAIAHRLARAISRFGPYSPRLAAALGRLRAGEADAFARPLAGSYHDVWMQLHEDLLLTLGLQRSSTDEA